jgi:serine/threonine protein kinase
VDGSLGRGGMSEVFHGYDERLDRRVAIKVLRPPQGPVPSGLDSPEAMEILDGLERDRKRFLREIRTAAQLEHPGTPAVYDTGVEVRGDGSTQVWLVMQLLRGTTLEAVLNEADYEHAPPGVAWAAAVTAQIAAVLTDLHRVDVVHRDIKPANVMITDGGLVKVLDFGIAILRGAGALPRLTQIDRTVGTPPYMSPEQCLGHAVTASSDIYSLGCLLFELLTGDPPFLATVDRPLRAQHLQSPVPSTQERRPDVPDDVATVVAAMLAKDPDSRPTAEAVYRALVSLAMQADEAAGDDRDPTRPFRHPLLTPPTRPTSRAALPPVTEAEFEDLQGRARHLIDLDRPGEAVRILHDGVERTGHDPFVHLRLRDLLAAALFAAGEYSRAAPLFAAVGDECRHYLPAADPLVLDSSYYAGLSYAEIGKPDRALPHLRFFVHHAGQADVERIAGARFAVAQMLASAGLADEAVVELRAVRPLLVNAFGIGSVHVRNLDRQLRRAEQQ